MTSRQRITLGHLLVLLMLCGNAGGARAADYAEVQVLLESGVAVSGERVHYPPGEARVAAMIVTLGPGEATGWHTHDVPAFAHVLSGGIEVEYEGLGRRSFRAGDSFMEAMRVRHNGVNLGDQPVRILVVFIGAEDAPNVRRESAPR